MMSTDNIWLSQLGKSEKQSFLDQLSKDGLPLSFFVYALSGPCFLFIFIALAAIQGYGFLACATSVISIAGILLFQRRGLIFAVSAFISAYLISLFFFELSAPVWKFGLQLSQIIALITTTNGIEACYELFEQIQGKKEKELQDTKSEFQSVKLTLQSDLDVLKKVLAQEKKQFEELSKEFGSLQLLAADLEQEKQISSSAEEKLQQMLIQSELQVRALVEEQKDIQLLDQELGEARKELNFYRVNYYQLQMLVEELTEKQSLQHSQIEVPTEPLQIEVQPPEQIIEGHQPDQPEIIIEKSEEKPSIHEILSGKEEEKIQIKKIYYDLLDQLNEAKVAFQKTPENNDFKAKVKELTETLKEKKAALTQIEREIFHMKKELRDQGALYAPIQEV